MTRPPSGPASQDLPLASPQAVPPVAALTQAELKFLGSMSTSSRAHFQPVPRDFGFHSPRDRGKLRDKVRAAVDAF